MKDSKFNKLQHNDLNIITPMVSLMISMVFVFLNIYNLIMKDMMWVKVLSSISLFIFLTFVVVNIFTIYTFIKQKGHINQKSK